MQTSRVDTQPTNFSVLPSRQQQKQSTGAASLFDKRKIAKDYIAKNLNQNFVWGRRDCVLFVADYLIELGHEDYAKLVRGTYKNKETARAMLGFAGFDSIKSCVDSFLVQKDVLRAQTGDIVMNGYNCLGIVAEGKAYFLNESKGLIGLKPDRMQCCWESSPCAI